MNPFESYAKQANTIVSRPPRLIGAIKTRKEAMEAYTAMVAGLHACDSVPALQAYLNEIEPKTLQFHAELDFLWSGDGEDFKGLEREIADAFETAEARQFFAKFPVGSGAGRITGYLEMEKGLGQ
jgi:hypothetical protein